MFPRTQARHQAEDQNLAGRCSKLEKQSEAARAAKLIHASSPTGITLSGSCGWDHSALLFAAFGYACRLLIAASTVWKTAQKSRNWGSTNSRWNQDWWHWWMGVGQRGLMWWSSVKHKIHKTDDRVRTVYVGFCTGFAGREPRAVPAVAGFDGKEPRGLRPCVVLSFHFIWYYWSMECYFMLFLSLS